MYEDFYRDVVNRRETQQPRSSRHGIVAHWSPGRRWHVTDSCVRLWWSYREPYVSGYRGGFLPEREPLSRYRPLGEDIDRRKTSNT